MFKFKEIEANYYGKWWDILDTEYPGYFDAEDEACGEETQSMDLRGEDTQSMDVPKTRFAEKRTLLQTQSKDPKINRQLHQSRPNQPYSEPTETNQTSQNQNLNYDRQTEMSRLLSNRLTLADGRRYLDNKEERADIERRMQSTSRRQSGSHSSRGRGFVTY